MTLPQQDKILLVEDEPTQRRLLRLQLEKQGYAVLEAEHGEQGLQVCLDNPDLRLVITDLMMPVMDGFQLIEAIRSREMRYTYIIVLTALDAKESIVRALSLGADDYLSKPVFQDELHLRLVGGKRLLQLEGHEELIFSLTKLAAYRSGETGAHLHRVREYCRILGMDLRENQPGLGLSRGAVEEIAKVCPLHDIGKVGVPDSILHKPGKLTAAEFELMKTHAELGGRLLREVYAQTGSSYLFLAYEIAMYHHERWDGKGYPRGLKGEEIPLAARMMALADVFDALVSRRSYKEPFPLETAKTIILEGRGTHFDPVVVDSFLRTEEQWRAVVERYGEENDDREALLGIR
ncbi:MAG: HD domain-containing phosphohydrolase [Thermodesulfobacteriota bacterium]